MRRTAITLVSLALAAVSLSATPAVAGGSSTPPAGPPTVVAGHLLSPLRLAVTPGGTAWFSQNFAGQLMRVRPGGSPVVKYQAHDGTEVGAVSYRFGVVTFATTSPSGRTLLKKRTRHGRIVTIANLSRYEKNHNPDAGNTYGIADLDEDCTSQWPSDQLGPPSYQGIVESHPYASFRQGRTTYVADAAGNAILAVKHGRVSAAAVLPPQPLEITHEFAAANGVPACAEGHEYAFEPVPTDVEMRGGKLYVTTLPGGPEDPSLGARGAVHRIDPRTGYVKTIVTGLLSSTGLAIAPNGDIYVAELFGNRISRIPCGSSTPEPWATVKMPGDVEYANGRIWATRKVLTGTSGQPGDRPRGQVIAYPRAS